MAVLGDNRQIRPGNLARLIQELDGTGSRRTLPGNNLHELALAIAIDTSQTDDLARANLKVHFMQQGAITLAEDDIAEHQRRRADRRRPPSRLEHDRSADHHAREHLPARITDQDTTHDMTAPKYDDAVREVEELVQLVGYEHDRMPGRRETAQDRGEALPFGTGQRRGRLVEDEQPNVAHQEFEDLHSLLLTDR